MPLTSEQIFTWAGKDKTRWRHLEGAVLIHNNFGECKITDFSEKNVYLGSLNKFSSFLSISKLATFESIPRGISEAITRDVQEAEQQREIRRHEMEAADRRKEDQRISMLFHPKFKFRIIDHEWPLNEKSIAVDGAWVLNPTTQPDWTVAFAKMSEIHAYGFIRIELEDTEHSIEELEELKAEYQKRNLPLKIVAKKKAHILHLKNHGYDAPSLATVTYNGPHRIASCWQCKHPQTPPKTLPVQFATGFCVIVGLVAVVTNLNSI